MKKLDTYIWRELLIPFLIGTVAVALMFSVNQLMFLLKTISVQNVPREAILQSLVFKLPFWLNMTLPVGVSLAASLAFTRLTRESELTAMRAAGTPILRVVWPVAIFGALVGLANFFLVEKVMPPAEKRFNELAAKIGILGVMPEFRANAVIYLKDYTATFGSVSRSPDDGLELQEVMLIRRPRSGEAWFVSAPSGEYRNGIWTLHEPTWRMFKGEDLIQIKAEEKMEIREKVILDTLFMPPQIPSLTLPELRQAIDVGRRTGSPTQIQEVAFHVKFAVPASCAIFAMVAPLFAILFSRAGGFAGVLLSILLVMLYYNVFVISTEIFGRQGWLPPVLAAWMPNAIFAMLGAWVARRLG